MRSRFLLLALLASGCFSSESTATGSGGSPGGGACYCDSETTVRVMPSYAKGAALNTRFLVYAFGKSEGDLGVALIKDGQAESLVFTPAGVPYTWWADPVVLQPNASYSYGGSTITTGQTEDHSPPHATSVDLYDEGRAGLCEATIGSALRIIGATDDGPAATMGLIAQLDMTSPQGGTHRVFLPFNVDANPQSVAFGRTIGGMRECLGMGRFEAVEDAEYDLTVTLWDSAGNSSLYPGFRFKAIRRERAGCPSGVTC